MGSLCTPASSHSPDMHMRLNDDSELTAGVIEVYPIPMSAGIAKAPKQHHSSLDKQKKMDGRILIMSDYYFQYS